MALLFIGAALVVIAAADVFATTLNYDGFSFLSSRGQRLGWTIFRGAAARLPGRWRDRLLAMAGPLLLPLSVAAWTSAAILGFGLIYVSGIDAGAFTLGPDLDDNLASALYLSGVTITTLGYGDITPQGAGYQLATVLEALMGFSLLTLSISYLSSTFGVLGSLSRLAGTLRASDADRRQPDTALSRYFHAGEKAHLSSFLQQLLGELRDYREGLRRYPIAYYFHPRDSTRSLPFAVAAVADIVMALRFCAPDESIRSEPWLLDLEDELDHTLRQLDERFINVDLGQVGPADPESPEGRSSLPDARETFRRKQAMVAQLTGSPVPEATDAELFRGWHGAAARRDSVLAALATDLGYQPSTLPAPVIAGEIDAGR